MTKLSHRLIQGNVTIIDVVGAMDLPRLCPAT